MILIFVSEITPRIKYTFDFIFKVRGVKFELTKNSEKFINYIGNKLNYSSLKLNSPQIDPSNICFSSKILDNNVKWGQENTWECLSFNGKCDPVASIFYILSRYEEYICDEYDIYGRFPYSKSILSVKNQVEKAHCDRWAVKINYFVDNSYKKEKNKVSIIPTFDIDNTFAYKLKTGKRMYLSLCRDVLFFKIKRLKERFLTYKGNKDPYDTYSEILKIANSFPKTLLFWLVGDYDKMDRNIPIENIEHQKLIKYISQSSEVNLHPSYASDGNVEIIKKEKDKLESIILKKVTKSRQHFLKFKLPLNYKSLIESGFLDDYSMGFAEHIGFKSGTSRPHFWFDLSQNSETKLIIHPFLYMDGTLNEYMLLSPDESKKKIYSIYNEVLEYGGEFIFIWHNETIGNYGKWKGWYSVLDYTLNLNHK